MAKVLITTVPFGNKNPLPFQLLEKAGMQYVVNPLNKKLTEDELISLVADFDILIAGTETISDKVMASAARLKFISRVGIGLDGVDLTAARKRGINVSYTPDAPAPAVAELTIGIMLTLCRSLHTSNKQIHERNWQRIFGRRLEEMTIGLIGYGRIGKRVHQHLKGFNCKNILVSDLGPDFSVADVNWVSKEEIYQQADLISLHLPLNRQTKDLITKVELMQMKRDAIVINTSRGGIINEQDLYDVLKSGHLASAGIDVFEIEPYQGPLTKLDNCFLTAHMGSMSVDCRTRMEIEATEEAVRFHLGTKLESLVPESEYELHTKDNR